MNNCPMRSASLIPARICWTVRDGAAVGGVAAAELVVVDSLGAVLGAVEPLVSAVGGVGVVCAARPPPDVHPASATTITAAAMQTDLTGPLSRPVGAAARWWRTAPGDSHHAGCPSRGLLCA